MLLKSFHFWAIVGLLVLIKLALTSDLAIQMIYSPHDDGLYVMRAFHLLWGEGMGPYDARTLVKLPGLSLWLAGNRLIGIPYLTFTHLLYAGAGAYFAAALRRSRFNDILILCVFALYLFNPVTLDSQWYRILREPISISFLVIMFAAIFFSFIDIREQRVPVLPVGVFSAVFAFALLVREEDRLLYGLWALFAAVILWDSWRNGGLRTPLLRIGVLFAIAFPLVAANIADAVVRSFMEKHYGAPILHDFGEGEFPRLIAAVRSIESRKDNRHVMITQEALSELRRAVPRFIPVIDRLPPPGPDSYSCHRFRVCSEWTNGWMLFWIKDAAYQAGLTPDLPTAQAYFRAVRLEIEEACRDGRLKCRHKGTGLFPTFELRWTRAYVHEWIGIMKMMWTPGFSLPAPLPGAFPVDVDYGRRYQAVTMTHYYDTQRQASTKDDAWKNYPPDLHLSLKYWLRYPDVAAAKDFSPNSPGEQLGALKHYLRHGRHEGRVWQEPGAQMESPALQPNPLASWRQSIVGFYQKYGIIFEWFALMAFVVRLALLRQIPPDPFTWVVLVFAAFTSLRLAGMSYVSVYMGGPDGRLFFSTYVVTMLMAPLVIADAIRAYRAKREAIAQTGLT